MRAADKTVALEAEDVEDYHTHSRYIDHGLVLAGEDQILRVAVHDTRSSEVGHMAHTYALAVLVEVEDAVRSLEIHRDRW